MQAVKPSPSIAEGPAEDRAGSENAQVPPELDGARLDAAAAKLFPGYSRARLQDWIEQGLLTRNGVRAVRTREAVHAGDRLELIPVVVAATSAAAQDIALQVVYEDAALALINKPPGLIVHPGAGAPDGTLQNALLHRFPQTAGVPRAGLVHRLDKDTSGLLVVALTLQAHTRLVAAMAARRIRREYDALVNGAVVAGGTVDAPIGRDPHNRLRMAVVEGGRVQFRPVTIAEDNGATVNLASGVRPGDQVVLNINSQIADGNKVDVVMVDGKPVATSANKKA